MGKEDFVASFGTTKSETIHTVALNEFNRKQDQDQKSNRYESILKYIF